MHTARYIFLIIFLSIAGLNAETVSFEKHIVPILREHCMECHGPNESKGGLLLHTRQSLLKGGKHGAVIQPGSAEKSELMKMITSGAPGESPEMPKKNTPLKQQEVAWIAEWINAGAQWPENFVVREKLVGEGRLWSVNPLQNVSPPTTPNTPSSWEKNPIDRFIYSKLQRNHLKPSPPADRRKLFRRAKFDLLGLPATSAEIEAFIKDTDPRAWEKLIDQMLDSPHYGERWARHWLDIAHFADTHGFERDKLREHAWRYRDYVIRSLNNDKPYNQFLREQIAGDVMDPDNVDSVIATGFLSAGPWDYVGQVETKSDQLKREARALDLDDMVTQVMTATVAMTVNCARCHNHKLDPISQEDYYSLWAVFAGVKRGDRDISDAATKVYTGKKAEIEKRLRQLSFDLASLQGKSVDLADIVGNGNGFGTGTKAHGLDPRNAALKTRSFGVLGKTKATKFAKSKHEFVDGVFIPDAGDGKKGVVISTTGLTLTDLPDTSGEAWDAIRHGPVASQDITTLNGIDYNKKDHSILGLHANAGITYDLAAIRKTIGQIDLSFESVVGYGGKNDKGRADIRIYLDGKIVFKQAGLGMKDGGFPVRIPLSTKTHFLTLVSTDGGNGIGFDQIFFGDPRLIPVQSHQLTDAEQNKIDRLGKEKLAVELELKNLGTPPKFYGIVSEKAPAVHVLYRGNTETPGAQVTPGSLSSVSELDSRFDSEETSEGQRRLALANWLVNPKNPLTRRVIVNRIWHWHFGQGIVKTPSDFGLGGDSPSHPELLDWLAEEFLRKNWSIKKMHRLILTSQTYRQSSEFNAKASAVDSDNRLLWRVAPRRNDAESLRDSVLFVSGKINLTMGGPGFRDFNYKEAYAPIYTYVTPDSPELWRRSIYRFVVRGTPQPFMTTLDCPNPANLTPARSTTTTALQSLALFNNDFILRQTRYFADRVVREAGASYDAQATLAFQLAFGRKPSKDERQLSIQLIKTDSLFALCRSLFNANEFVYLD